MLMKMRSKMQRTANEKGFTLVELMVVVVIIGVLVAIAVPVYNSVTTNAANSADSANIRTLRGAANTAIATLGRPSATVTWTGNTSGGASNGGALADYNWENWVQSPFPRVPEGATSGTTYTVTLNTNGTVTVAKP